MKSPAGYGQPRRKGVQKQVRLNLRRTTPRPSPEEQLETRQKGNFWKWFAVVALFHVFLFIIVILLYRPSAPKPPPTFINLMPDGDIVKGKSTPQSAPKLGATTLAPAVHHHHKTIAKPPTPPQEETPPPTPVAIKPPPVEHVHPKPIIGKDAPPLAEIKPKPAKPAPPKPKVKVDLTLADAPDSDTEKPVHKVKAKKKTPPPAEERNDKPDQEASHPDTHGLSKEKIAQLLGDNLEASGVDKAVKTGASGSSGAHEKNPYGDFYATIMEQIINKWQEPNLIDPQAVDPVILIHVEKDGHVPTDRVTLVTSSGNRAIDDSALAAARSLGYLLQPLPDGCPPDISITLKLTH